MSGAFESKKESFKEFFGGKTGDFVGWKSGYFEGKYENAKLNLWQQALLCRSLLLEYPSFQVHLLLKCPVSLSIVRLKVNRKTRNGSSQLEQI